MPPRASAARDASSSRDRASPGLGTSHVVLAALAVIVAIAAGCVATAGGPRLALWLYLGVPAVPDAANAIYVGIASYCDRELDTTLTQLFSKAKHPARVHVGLVLQEKRHVRDAEPLARWRDHPNVRVMEFDPEESKGAGWARTHIAKMHRGEAYYMQLDSHHLFVHAWDAACVSMLNGLEETKSSKPILTSYVHNYPENSTDTDKLVRELPWRMTAGHWMKPFSGLTPKKIQYLPAPVESHIMKASAGKPQITAFFSAHFVFVRSAWLEEVPYDPEMYFDGEEDSLGLRSWTNGWDLYYPSLHVAFHRYERKNQTKHWDDHPGIFHNMTISSIKRLSDIIDTRGGPNGSDALGKFGLGKVRSIENYQDFAGVDYDKMWLSTRARYGEITARQPANSVPKLWVHKDGHFQMHKFEKWGEVWEEWKHRGAAETRPASEAEKKEGKGPTVTLRTVKASYVVSRWTVTQRDINPPRPNLHMKDTARGMEINLTPEGCFYRFPNVTENNPQLNWTLMSYGYWM